MQGTTYDEIAEWYDEQDGYPRFAGGGADGVFQKPPSEHNLTGLEAYILNMYAVTAWRGQGIAIKLLQTLIASAKQHQAHRIWMYSTQDGQPIYERAGFVPKQRHTLEMELIW